MPRMFDAAKLVKASKAYNNKLKDFLESEFSFQDEDGFVLNGEKAEDDSYVVANSTGFVFVNAEQFETEWREHFDPDRILEPG